MYQTLTPQQWVDKNVDTDLLVLDVAKSIAEGIRFENIEDGTYYALVHDIVSGNHGRYIPAFALKYFEYEGIDTDDLDKSEEVEFIHDELEFYASKVEAILNQKLPNGITVSFGYWDADGTYCLMAFLSEQEYQNMKEESFNFVNDILASELKEVE